MYTIQQQRAERIAKNINAMDVNYQYSDDRKEYKFWNELRLKLIEILCNLSDDDKTLIYSLCEPEQAAYFGLKAEQLNINTMKTFRTKVFKRAYEIKRNTGKSFAVALSKAWALYRLTKKLKTTEKVEFTYEKTDGSLRRAIGTLIGASSHIKGTAKTSTDESVLRYWDLGSSGFRSFRVENLVTVF